MWLRKGSAAQREEGVSGGGQGQMQGNARRRASDRQWQWEWRTPFRCSSLGVGDTKDGDEGRGVDGG